MLKVPHFPSIYLRIILYNEDAILIGYSNSLATIETIMDMFVTNQFLVA